MRVAKFEPAVYHALKAQGLSNRQIAKQLDVNEASVRRGLRAYAEAMPSRRYVVSPESVLILEEL